MSLAELKLDIIHRISIMSDQARLKELLQILEFQSDESLHVTTADEKQAILDARKEVVDGKVMTDEQVQKEISEWLKK